MKTCVSTYSYGHYNNDLGIFGLIDKTAELGIDAIEILPGCFGGDIEMAKKAREHAAEKGIPIANVSTGADFLNGSNGILKDEIKRVCGIVDIAAALGTKCMRHDVSSGFSGRSYSIGYDDALPRLAEGCREVTKYAEQKGIVTCTENHGFFSQDSVRVEKLINTVAHPNFGALVDLGNFLCADEEPTMAVGRMAPYAKHVHVKDFHKKSGMEINPGGGWFCTRAGNYIRGAIIGHGEAHVFQSLSVLKKSGYDGYLSIEFEGLEDNIDGITIGLRNLKRYIEMLG